jgi:ABC-type ATPase involved in cell division
MNGRVTASRLMIFWFLVSKFNHPGNMRLSAFRIKNFRSIVDSGWQSLSPDNITCLIGQNESGKTSVLEGLQVFYSGTITEDILRSDLSLPEISCRFDIPKGWLVDVTNNPGPELKELLSGLNCLELTRYWLEDFSSLVKVSGEISQYLDSLENAWRLYLDELARNIYSRMAEINQMDESLKNLELLKMEISGNLSSEHRSKGFKFFRKKISEPDSAEKIQLNDFKKQLKELDRQISDIKNKLTREQTLKRAGEVFINLKKEYEVLDHLLQLISVKLEERHQRMTLLMKPGDDSNDSDWMEVLNNYRIAKSNKDSISEAIDRQTALCGYIMEGRTEQEASKKVEDITRAYKSQYTSEIIGKKYFEYCPVYEMFEDFGSLLPNRIDLDDILTGNKQVEGFKAARNFLTIAQLDYTFFQQPSNRILKQKIENLNQTLTLNFQDFWQQSIGRNNKIRIQFELEHYNSTHGEKAGKPYLEFWIKDESERLYPKQRSRGVRWFLSFYMELKASATIYNRPMVLLIDEPGVSLHARAQEDVLKVFEDIKGKIQIIYTTHSPHLVDINKLHRLLAVQRDDVESIRSTTRIIDPMRLSNASPDTLTPLQSIMGNPLASEGFSAKRFNLIVNNTGSFYFLNAVMIIMGFKGKINLIPSTNVSSIPLMCNILMGWGMEFAVLLFENEEENRISEILRNNILRIKDSDKEVIVNLPGSYENSEDLLSTLDFKNHLLNSRVGITVTNSAYLKEKDLPRNFILSSFLSDVKSGKIKSSDLDEETLENFRQFTDIIKGLK